MLLQSMYPCRYHDEPFRIPTSLGDVDEKKDHIYVTAMGSLALLQVVKASLLTDPSLKLGYAFTLMGPRTSVCQQHELDHQITQHRGCQDDRIGKFMII